jgi:hypothetical protein
MASLITIRLYQIRLVIISLFVMSLSFSAQANDELQLELKGQPYTTELIDDYNGKCEQFVRDSGFSVGVNTKPDGGLFYIATGTGTINAPVGGPQYGSKRWVAYEKALLQAKKSMVEFMRLEAERRTSFEMLSPQDQEKLKENASSEELKEIKHYEDTRDLGSAWQKSIELLNRDLDAKLAETEPKASEPPVKSLDEVVEKHKELGSERYKNTTILEAMHRLTGVRILYMADKSPKNGKGEICVATVYSSKLKQIADAMAAKDLSLMPATAPGGPIDSFIPDKGTNAGRSTLVNKMGVDVRADDQGNFWLISYGQAGPEKEGNKISRNKARRLAEIRAIDSLRAYIGENLSSNAFADTEEVSTAYQGNVPDADTLVEVLNDKTESIMAKIDISGSTKSDVIGLRHPTSGNEIWVAIYKWSSETLAGAKKLSKDINTPPKPKKAANTTGTKKTKKSTTGYEGDAAGGTGCEKDDSHRLKSRTVVSLGIGDTRKDALLDGLEDAISQVNGVSIASQANMSLETVTIENDNDVSFFGSEKFQKAINTSTKGLVRCWKILSDKEDSSNDEIRIKMFVTVTKYDTGVDLTLPRIATTNFYYGRSVKSKSAALKIASQAPKIITDVLSKSKKLALIDRQYMELTETELKLIQSHDFQLEEMARIGNRVGTDYLIVGTVTRANEWVKKRTMISTGKVFRSKIANGTISYRVIDVATSKILFADEVAFEGEYSLDIVANYLGQAVGVNILNSFFPGSALIKEPPKPKKNTLKEVEKFAKDSIKQLKEESKNDY